MWYILLVIPEIKCECHSSLTVTIWTRHVHSTMLEHTRMNQILRRVLGITGAWSLSHLTCIPSDLTSISHLHWTSLPLHWSFQKPSQIFQHSHNNQNQHNTNKTKQTNKTEKTNQRTKEQSTLWNSQPHGALPRSESSSAVFEKLKPTQNSILGRLLWVSLKIGSFLPSRIKGQKILSQKWKI